MEDLFHAALPFVGSERDAFVAQCCDADTVLCDEVKSLLVSDDRLENFLEEPVAQLSFIVLADEKAFLPTVVVSEPLSQVPRNIEGHKLAGRYEVVKRIGGGGFGDVYKAVDRKIMSRPVVIKVLRDDLLEGDEVKRDWVITKFKQEIEALAKIDDPGVVHLLDADSLPDGRPYIVMEFVDGVDLRHFIKDARLEHTTEQGLRFEDVAEIVKQVGRTLSAAHKQDIYHRDLKPENIMLRRNASGDLQVKVIDFGIARVRNSLVAPSTATGHFFIGTWQYMSPEQLARKKVDAAADIYSLGVIAFEMLTGRYPFPASDAAQLKDLQEKGIKIKPCHLVPALPITAQNAVLKALEYYPAERYRSARDFGDGLAYALATVEELVRPRTPMDVNLEGKTLDQDKGKVDDTDQSPPHRNLISKPARRWTHLLLAASIAVVVGLTAWWTFKTFVPSKEAAQQNVLPSGPERSLTLWLQVRMPKGDGSFDEFESTGEEAFNAGSKIYFRVQPIQEGYLYVINEGMGENGTKKWTALFPNPSDNDKSARLSANKLKKITGMTLDDYPGDEIIHFVWAVDPVRDLEPLFSFEFTDTDAGVLAEPAQQNSLRDFFQRNQEDPKGKSFVNGSQPRIILKGHGDLLVGSITIKHRKYGSS